MSDSVPIYWYTCKVCGKKFTSYRLGVVCCSNSCRSKLSRLRKKGIVDF